MVITLMDDELVKSQNNDALRGRGRYRDRYRTLIESLFDPDTDSDPDADKAEIVLFTRPSMDDGLVKVEKGMSAGFRFAVGIDIKA